MIDLERTLVLVKPDGMQRRLVGEVISRFERAGLKIVGIKLLNPTKAQVELFYPTDEAWFKQAGERSTKTFRETGMNIKEKFETEDPVEIGKMIKRWIVRFMTSGKIVALVLEGNKAVENVRKMIGETTPTKALPGTIRGDFSIDNVIQGNISNRPMTNVVHASENLDEAKREMAVWFKNEELFDYKRDNEDVFYKVW